jgi:hypothetical protein
MPKVTWKRAWDVLAVLLTFSCTGTVAAFASGRVSAWLGLKRWSLPWWIAWALLIFPLYHVLLVGFAFVFGKYEQFRDRELRLLRRVRGWLGGGPGADPPK